MRDALNNMVMSLDAIIVGAVCAQLLRTSALIYVGVSIGMAGAVALLYAIRDVICALLRRFGREADPNMVLVHMCASVMALLGLAFVAHPRGGWIFVVLLPAATYIMAFVPGWVSATVWKLGWRLLEKMVAAPRARPGRRRR